MSQPDGNIGRFSMFAEDGGVAAVGVLPSARNRAARSAAVRASVDLEQLRAARLSGTNGGEAAVTDISAEDFISDARLRFQQLLNGVGDQSSGDAGGTDSSDQANFVMSSNGGGGPGVMANPGDSGLMKQLLKSTNSNELSDKSLMNKAPMTADRFGGRLQRPGFGDSGRRNGAVVTHSSGAQTSSVSSSSRSMMSSSSSSSSSSAVVRSGSSILDSASGGGVVGGGTMMLPPDGTVAATAAESGLVQAPQVSSSRQQTFKQSRTSSNTVFSQSMDGGPAQTNTSRHVDHQQTHACTENGATSVQQRRAQQLDTATITEQDGETQLQAQRAQLAQNVTAQSAGDGVTQVQEQVHASGATRQATFEQGEDGEQKQTAASGQDFSANAQIDYVHESNAKSPGQFKINCGPGLSEAGGGRRPPPWRFSAFGPLIQPPSGKIRGQVTIQASQSMFNCQAGALPRFEESQYSFQDEFEVSESDSDDEDALYLSAPRRRRARPLRWRGKLALPDPTEPAAGDGTAPLSPSVAPSEAPSELPGERDEELGDDVAQAEEEQQRRRERLARIAEELTVTERKYVDELHLIDQIFHFRVDQENRAHHMFNNEITQQMFSNVKSIYQFHKEYMLPQLEARLQSWDDDPRIGDIMKQNAPFLKMYTEFVKNFDNAMNLINAFAAKCSRFAAIMDEIHEMDECGNLPLQHHMIVPIQRVPRYELLLKDYLKRLTDDSPDYEDTKKALELVTHAATHSNEAMRRVDQFKQLLEIQENISGGPDLVSPTRQLVKEGKITKISARSGDHQERYLFLFSDLLLLCSPRLINNRIISGPAYRLRARFSIEGLQVLEGDNLETLNTFYVNGNQKNVEIYTQTPEEKAEWLEALCRVITSFYERRASLKADPHGSSGAELGRRAPVMLRQDATSRCMDCESQFGLMRRKHNCHACGIVVCSKCSGNKVPLPCEQNKPARVCNRCFHLLQQRTGGAGGATTTSPTQTRRESVLDVSYTRGKGVLDVPASAASLLCGYLQLRSRKTWFRRWFCLRADFVLYSYQSPESARALTATPVPGFTVQWGGGGARAEHGVPEKERDKSLKLFHARKAYVFIGDGREDVARWVAALQKAARAEALAQTPQTPV